MTVSEIMAIELIKIAMVGVYFLILYFKIDKIKDEVAEIKRKMEGEE